MSWLQAPASVEAGVLAEVGWVLIAGAAIVFALVMVLLALALRRRKRALPVAWWVIGGGIAFPVVVLSVLLGYGVWRTAGLAGPSAPALVVTVTGHSWWWDVRYADPATGRQVVLANELRLPAGRPARIALASADVIHSFWVPTLGGKMDLVPGRTNRIAVTPLEPGVHRGACAEYCGVQHARMALDVVVQPPDAFERWLARQAEPARAPAGATVEHGRRAFAEHGCAGCHTVRGAFEAASLGPDLTHVGSRLRLGAGTLTNDADGLARWIADVQSIKPGARMPSFRHLDRATLDALVAYLAQLK